MRLSEDQRFTLWADVMRHPDVFGHLDKHTLRDTLAWIDDWLSEAGSTDTTELKIPDLARAALSGEQLNWLIERVVERHTEIKQMAEAEEVAV